MHRMCWEPHLPTAKAAEPILHQHILDSVVLVYPTLSDQPEMLSKLDRIKYGDERRRNI